MKIRITPISVVLFIYLVIFVLHFTIAEVVVPPLTNVYYACTFLFLGFLLSRNKVETITFPLIFAAIVSMVLSTNVTLETYMRFFSWILVLLVAGPLLQNKKINKVRDHLFWWIIYIYVFITIGSLIWVMAGLPSLAPGKIPIAPGREYFRNGIAQHEMLLAPMAGISAIFAWHNLFFLQISRRTRILNVILFFCACATMLMASSRVVLVSVLLTFIFSFSTRFGVFLKKIRKNTGWVSLAVIVLLFALAPAGIYLSKFIENNTRIEAKGTANSRVEMWAARFADFELNPFSGAGFASVSKEVIENENLRSGVAKGGQIEFGSLYLQVLSTMGALGVAALLLFFGRIFFIGYINRMKPMAHLPLLLFIFLVLQAIAETHIFAAGDVLCVFSWLVFTRLYNLQYIHRINLKPVQKASLAAEMQTFNQQRLQEQ